MIISGALEIHTPHSPIHSYKEMLVHLALVTLGVLIALSFEGIATWREHRALVREARINLTNEIRDNITELRQRLQSIPREQQNLEHAIDMLQVVMKRMPLEGKIEIGFSSASLQGASRSTAQMTGAFALMEYDEVKKYATVYGHQDLYLQIQSDAMQVMTRAIAVGALFSSPETATPRELEDARTQLRLALATLLTQEQIGASLLKEYERVLKER